MIRLIESIPKDQGLDSTKKGPTTEDLLQVEMDRYFVDNKAIKEKLEQLFQIKQRFSQIIDVCEVNSIQNEKWITVSAA